MKSMIVIGSNTLDNGQSYFTEDISHFMELQQNRHHSQTLMKRTLVEKMGPTPVRRTLPVGCRAL